MYICHLLLNTKAQTLYGNNHKNKWVLLYGPQAAGAQTQIIFFDILLIQQKLKFYAYIHKNKNEIHQKIFLILLEDLQGGW